MPMIIRGSSGITFPDGTVQSTAAGASVGIGQSWQNVTSTRALSTTYTNSTGKPIQVIVNLAGGAPGAFSYTLSINGNQVSSTGSDHGMTLIFIVPNSQTYQVTSTDGLNTWWELR